MSSVRVRRDSAVRLLALGGIAAPIIFAILVTVGGFIYQGYNHATQAISELGGVEARYPLIQNANFFMVGVLIMAFAFGLHRGMGHGNGPVVGFLLLGAFGVLTVAQTLLPCDSGCEFESPIGALHNMAGLSGFLTAIAGILVTSRRLRRDPNRRSYAGYSAVTAIAALVGLFAWIGISKAAGVQTLNGVLQRIVVGLLLLWVEVMALRLFWLSRLAPMPQLSDS